MLSAVTGAESGHGQRTVSAAERDEPVRALVGRRHFEPRRRARSARCRRGTSDQETFANAARPGASTTRCAPGSRRATRAAPGDLRVLDAVVAVLEPEPRVAEDEAGDRAGVPEGDVGVDRPGRTAARHQVDAQAVRVAAGHGGRGMGGEGEREREQQRHEPPVIPTVWQALDHGGRGEAGADRARAGAEGARLVRAQRARRELVGGRGARRLLAARGRAGVRAARHPASSRSRRARRWRCTTGRPTRRTSSCSPARRC